MSQHRIGDRPHPNVVLWRAIGAGAVMIAIPLFALALLIVSWNLLEQ